MRFLEDGADIPDVVIRAANAGNVTFLCGAGVSFRVGLPSFERLTGDVYRRLGESSDEEVAERIAMRREEYDRALRSLEKRTHRPHTKSRVRVAVAEILAAPSCDLPDQLTILKLSRDSDGRPRVLTTNFDTLFERAAHANGTNVPSHWGRLFRGLAVKKTGVSFIFTGELPMTCSIWERANSC